jgi:hypothetical protein
MVKALGPASLSSTSYLKSACYKRFLDKNYKLAVDSYKNALKANSKDEKTRYNLALAKKLLKKYPPKSNPNLLRGQSRQLDASDRPRSRSSSVERA